MKRDISVRKLLALCLCLVLLLGVTALPILAAPEGDEAPAQAEPAAPAVEKAEPAAREETPAKEETSSQDAAPAKEETSTKEETPAEDTSSKEETSAQREETPAEDTSAKEETSTEREETPAGEEAAAEDETPVKEEAPAGEEPAAQEETPAEKETAAPRESAQAETVEDERAGAADEDAEAPASAAPAAVRSAAVRSAAASLFSVGTAAEEEETLSADEAHGFSFDWSQEALQDSGWDSTHGVVETSRGYYLYFDCGEWASAALNVYAADDPYTAVMGFSTSAGDPEHVYNTVGDKALWADESIEVHYYTSGGRRYTEVFVPAALLPEGDFTFACNNAAFPFVSETAQGDAEAAEAEPTPEPVYTGIVIDGKFDDWAAVPRYEIDDGRGYNTVDHVSVVWDGEWVYILLTAEGDRDWQGELTGYGNWNSVTGAGTHGNGQFAITTDLGRTLLVQPVVDSNNEPAVAGVDGAQAAVNNKEWAGAPHLWELAIPASELPEYLETISFGFYLAEPTVTGLSDMQSGDGGVDPFAADVVIDGKYNDWVGYPHTLIQYDHEGIQYHEVDGEAALWSDDGWLYGHVVTEHPDHLDEQGSEFLAAISIAFNGDRDYKDTPDKGNFYPRILAIAEDGTVTDYYTTVNEGHSTPNGTYTYYIFDTRTDPVKQFGHTDENGVWHDATAADLIENAFGTMKVTVTGEKDDMEFDLDLKKVADYIGADAADFKTIEAQFGRIGQQWVTTAGTSTWPLLGAALAVCAVGAPMCCGEVRRRRARRKGEGENDGGEK